MTNSILLQSVSAESLTELITNIFKTQLEAFKNDFQNQAANDDLMTRNEVLELLQINASTLWHYQNKGKIIAYKFANKNYYKRTQIMESLQPLKK